MSTHTEIAINEDAAGFRAAGWWRKETYVDDFLAAAARTPQHTAIVAHRKDGPLTTLSYGELAQEVDRFAAGLTGLGVRRGDIVAVQLPDWWEFAALTLGCARIGAVICPIMPILREREVGHILERTDCRVCVVPERYRDFSYADMVAGLRPRLPHLEHVLVLATTPDLPVGLAPFAEAMGRESVPLDVPRPHGDDLAELAFSSGTTGEPKGVLHTFNTLGMAAAGPWATLGLSADEVVLMPSPVTHALGFLYGVLMPLSRGMTVVYQDVWDAPLMLELVERYRVSWTMAATPFIVDAVRAQRDAPRDVASLRHVLSGGAPIPSALVGEARTHLGAQLVAVWGMTENGVVTITGPDDPDEVVADSDGQPVPWMRIRVVDESGRPVAPNAIGRLQVSGAAQTVGYYHRPDLYQAALVDDGWFDTGDLARLRPDGGIRIAGRVKDLIIRGGENVPVVEVENALYHHPRVAQVAVVGYPDERLGERVCAVIVPDQTPPTLADLTEHLARLGMTPNYWPERVEVVDQLPKTASGKIQKYVLREMIS